MAMDIVDMFVNTSDEYLTGYFYARRPKTPEDGRVTFKYKQLDPNARVFDTVLGNVRSDSATYAIKTNDHCGFNVGGYIVTQNGLCWTITEVITNEQVNGENAVLRWFTGAKNAECSVRMLQVDSLFAVENAYTKCKVDFLFVGDGLGFAQIHIGCLFSATVGGKEISQNEIKVETYAGSANIKSISVFAPKGSSVVLTVKEYEMASTSSVFYARSYQTKESICEIKITELKS